MNSTEFNERNLSSAPGGLSLETTSNAHIIFIKIPDTYPRWYYFGESKFLLEFQISMLFINFIIRTVAFVVNVVTINVIRINKKLHSPLNFLIASLCVCRCFTTDLRHHFCDIYSYNQNLGAKLLCF